MNYMQEVYQLYRVINELRTLLQEMISLVFVNKKFHINVCPILDGHRITAAWNVEWRVRIIYNKGSRIIKEHND